MIKFQNTDQEISNNDEQEEFNSQDGLNPWLKAIFDGTVQTNITAMSKADRKVYFLSIGEAKKYLAVKNFALEQECIERGFETPAHLGSTGAFIHKNRTGRIQ